MPNKGIMPVMYRSPINANNDDDHYEALVEIKTKCDKNYYTLKDYNFILIGYMLWFSEKKRDHGPMKP